MKTNIEVFVQPLKGRVICVVWFRSNLVSADNAITSGGRSRRDNGFAEYSSSVQLLCVAETGSGVDPSVRSNPITCPRRRVASRRFIATGFSRARNNVRPSVGFAPRANVSAVKIPQVCCVPTLYVRGMSPCVWFIATDYRTVLPGEAVESYRRTFLTLLLRMRASAFQLKNLLRLHFIAFIRGVRRRMYR